MKHITQTILCCILVFGSLPLFAQNFRVQIAAYVEKVPFSYFSEAQIFGVYMLTDQNNIYRYYLGEFNTKEEAEKARAQAATRGFKHASIIDVEEQRRLCGKPCPYISETSMYADESTEALNLSNIFFGFDQATLTNEAKRELDKVVKIMKENKVLKILVSGHTDSQGSAEYNILLSKRRARNAKNYLINRGIKHKRITAQVFGEYTPSDEILTQKGNNEDEKSEKFKRRVVLAIYDPNNGEVILNKKRRN